MQHVPRYWTYQEEKMSREYTNTQIANAIDEHIHNKRDRAILKSRYIDGICYEPLAEMYDLSVTRVKRIVYKYEKILFEHLT